MLHHYLTQYGENGKQWVEAWLQFNIFGLCFCFSKRKFEIYDQFIVGGKPVEQIVVSRDNKEVIAVISNTGIIGHKSFQIDVDFKEA